MKRYVLLAGGSGARVAEALLCGACAGVFQAETLEVLLADPDRQGAAALLKAKYADYERMRSASAELHEGPLAPFHTRLTFRAWPERLPGGARTMAQWASASEADALLCQALFDEEALSLDLMEGFHGRRPLGAAVMAGLLHEAQDDPEDALRRFAADMRDAADQGEEVRVVLAGSVCGGTGAAGMPLLARFIQEQTAGRVRIGAVLLASGGDHEDSLKAKEAIAAFAGESACDAVCVLGLPRSSCSGAPADYAHLMDWLAVYGIDVLLHRPQWPSGLFTVKAEEGPMSWAIFGRMADRYRKGYGRLIKAAAAWAYCVGPQVEKRLRHPMFLRDGLFGWYAHFFRRAAGARNAHSDDAAAMTRLMSVMLLWLGGLMRTLPPEMLHAREMMQAQEAAQAHYDSLTALVSQLAILDEDVQREEAYEQSFVYRHDKEDETGTAQTLRRIDAVKQEIVRRRAEQEELNRRAGGFAAMQMLQDALEAAEADCQELDERYREANRRIDHAESIAAPEDQYRITDARTKLDRMVRHRQALTARLEQIREDSAKMAGAEARFSKPVIAGAAEPDGLFAAALTERLLPQGKRLSRADVEKMWSAIVLPRDGVSLKQALKKSRKAAVNQNAPVMSLLYALTVSALEEV